MELVVWAKKASTLLKQIFNHDLARNFYSGPFLPNCQDSKGAEYNHMDKNNPLKCMFSANQVGREWSGLCPGHRTLFLELLNHAPEEIQEPKCNCRCH